jgi:hypothetical protein
MSVENAGDDEDSEIAALAIVFKALKGLEPTVQIRVLRYAAERLGIGIPKNVKQNEANHTFAEEEVEVDRQDDDSPADSEDQDDGISTVALKWMKRSGIKVTDLGSFFSVGGEEIDFVAETMPGKSKRERMHNVILLKSIAAYLSSGVARATYEQIKEACLHYNAFDGTNFAQYLKDFSAEVSGTKEAGYTLSPRGLTVATAVVKSLISKKPKADN